MPDSNKSLDTSKNIPLTSSDGYQSNEQISWTVGRSWLSQESYGLKLDLLELSKLFIELKSSFS